MGIGPSNENPIHILLGIAALVGVAWFMTQCSKPHTVNDCAYVTLWREC